MYQAFTDFIKAHQHLSIIQAENPDGDSLGAALALEQLLDNHTVSLYCPTDIPKYLHYFDGWSRVNNDFDLQADAYIIVDTAATVLLSKLLAEPTIKQRLFHRPILVLDHHETPDDLPFPHTSIIQPHPACCDLLYQIIKAQKLPCSTPLASHLLAGIMSDTLGLTSAAVSATTLHHVAELVEHGANISDIEERRREFMKKSPRILSYKADLIKRIIYHLDGSLATVHIPWAEIREYSDQYNPNVLILEEMRLVEDVTVAIAIKTYPDGKLTGKIRTAPAAPIADQIAAYFGGGGHPFAAGFRCYDTDYESIIQDLLTLIPQLVTTHAA